MEHVLKPLPPKAVLTREEVGSLVCVVEHRLPHRWSDDWELGVFVDWRALVKPCCPE